jgi:hypothetical protein
MERLASPGTVASRIRGSVETWQPVGYALDAIDWQLFTSHGIGQQHTDAVQQRLDLDFVPIRKIRAVREERGTFRFDEEGRAAFAIPEVWAGEIVDWWAFHPDRPELACLTGGSPILQEWESLRRIFMGEAVFMHEDVLDWLRSGGDGTVWHDRVRCPWSLGTAHVIVANLGLGIALDGIFKRAGGPKIDVVARGAS